MVKCRTTNFFNPSLSFVAVFGSGIRDLDSGSGWTKIRIRDKLPDRNTGILQGHHDGRDPQLPPAVPAVHAVQQRRQEPRGPQHHRRVREKVTSPPVL
jgi:hypothetical protein